RRVLARRQRAGAAGSHRRPRGGGRRLRAAAFLPPARGHGHGMTAGGCGTILLTGASGFVGRHVAAALREAGYVVRAAVRDAGRAPPGTEPFLIGDLAAPVDWGPALEGV